MPRFFFHFRDGKQLTRDAEGIELVDLDSAQTEALAAAREFLANQLRAGRLDGDYRFEIADDRGQKLATVLIPGGPWAVVEAN
jgi:hypothetical protein